MKAVFSFLNTTGNPLIEARNFMNPKLFLYSWVLSTHLAKQQFGDVEIVTDSDSSKLFEKLKLPVKIKTNLNLLKDIVNPELWALGKIKAYEIQEEPFIHIDNDVFLFGKLPDNIHNVDAFFQQKEDLYPHVYQEYINTLNEKNNGLVESWGLENFAFNTAIYACNNLDYNKEYCRQAFELVYKNEKRILQTGGGNYCVIFEQYLASCVAKQLNIKTDTLLENYDNSKVQYVHVWGEKRNIEWFNNIETIIKRDYSNHYEIINELIK